MRSPIAQELRPTHPIRPLGRHEATAAAASIGPLTPLHLERPRDGRCIRTFKKIPNLPFVSNDPCWYFERVKPNYVRGRSEVAVKYCKQIVTICTFGPVLGRRTRHSEMTNEKFGDSIATFENNPCSNCGRRPHGSRLNTGIGR